MTTLTASPLVSVVEGIGAIGDNVLVMVVRIPQRLDAELLQRAIRATAVNLPELGGRPKQGAWRTHWELDEAPRWTVVEHADADEALAEQVERDLFAAPHHLEGELPLVVQLVHLCGGDCLLLRISHLLADGGGTKELVYRIAAAYRALDADPEWSPAPLRRPHALVRLVCALRPWRIPAYLLGVLDDLWSLRPGRGLTPPMVPATSTTARYGRLHLGADRVAALVALYKPRGVTINDLLVTAMARGLDTLWDPTVGDEVNLVCTADLRPLVAAAEQVENFSLIHTLRMGRRPLPPVVELLEHTQVLTRRWKSGYVGLGVGMFAMALAVITPAALLRRAIADLVLNGPPKRLGPVVFTNMGRIDPTRLDFGGGPCTRAYILPPIGHPPALIAAATGCAGAVDVTVAHREPSLGAEQVQELLDRVEAELDALAAAG